MIRGMIRGETYLSWKGMMLFFIIPHQQLGGRVYLESSVQIDYTVTILLDTRSTVALQSL